MSEPTVSTSGRGVLTRLYWMLIGPALMLVAAGLIAKHPTWSLGWKDFMFWAAIASLIAVRWLDVRRFGGLTADGEPATLRHLRRHALLILGIGTAVWPLAQAVFL